MIKRILFFLNKTVRARRSLAIVYFAASMRLPLCILMAFSMSV